MDAPLAVLTDRSQPPSNNQSPIEYLFYTDCTKLIASFWERMKECLQFIMIMNLAPFQNIEDFDQALFPHHIQVHLNHIVTDTGSVFDRYLVKTWKIDTNAPYWTTFTID